jgi:hypothetical protein
MSREQIETWKANRRKLVRGTITLISSHLRLNFSQAFSTVGTPDYVIFFISHSGISI